MTNWKSSIFLLTLLVLMSSGHAAFGQPPQPPASSAQSSPNSGIPANSEACRNAGTLACTAASAYRVDAHNSQPTTQDFINACAAAVDELRVTRLLVSTLEDENRALRARLETEKQTSALLLELNETRKSENEALRLTVSAKNETIAAKDAALETQQKLIDTLKRKKTSPWKRVADILVGAGIAAILK